MDITEKFFEVDGLRIRFIDIGEGEPLILVHGLGECIESWRHQIPVFSRYFRTIALDLRGFGKSSRPKHFNGIYDFVNDLKGLLDYLRLDEVNLLGFSMGGMISLAFYEAYPDRVKSLILSDAISHIPKKTLKKMIDERLGILDTKGMEGLAEYLSEISFHLDGEEKILFKESLLQNDPEYYKEVTVKILNADLRRVLPKIKCPTLILVGEFDRTTPPKLMEYMVRKIPNSEIRIVDNSAHMTKIENPAEFNDFVINFLKKTIVKVGIL